MHRPIGEKADKSSWVFDSISRRPDEKLRSQVCDKDFRLGDTLEALFIVAGLWKGSQPQRVSALIDMRRKAGMYTIQVSRRVSDNPKDHIHARDRA
jgi:hypothetical protein